MNATNPSIDGPEGHDPAGRDREGHENHPAHHVHGDHGGHGDDGGHAHGGKHAGHHTEAFRRRFWWSLLLTIPVVATSHMVMV